MPVVALGEVVGFIRERLGATGSRIVAIDGAGGSGKSTLAGRLRARLPGSVVVPIDDFGSWVDPVGATWWQRFDEQVLTPASAGQAFRYQCRDWEHDEFGDGLAGWRDVPTADVVIVEGVTSARQSVRQRGAFTIWVDAAGARCLERGLARDGESHRDLWVQWMKAEQDFFAQDGTRAKADLRVDGDPSERHDPGNEVVLL